MPSSLMFLVRRVRFGHQYTVISTSKKAALREFFVKFKGAEPGEDFKIKTREVDEDWETYRWKGNGQFRKVPG